MVDNRASIIEKIDLFIRKFYKNKLIKGIIYTVALLLSLFLIASISEHFGYFGTVARTFIFWFIVVIALVVLWFYILLPLLKMHRLGKRISREEAANIIGRYFPEVSDRLLNLLQLQNAQDESANELLHAAIEQKTKQLSPIPFSSAINLRENLKYLKYAVVPILIIVLILFISPSFITESSNRLIHHSTIYEKPAPFTFVVTNSSLEARKDEDFLLEVHIDGDALPDEAFIVINNAKYRLKKKNKRDYSYIFKKIRTSTTFSLQTAGVTSPQYTLSVIPIPELNTFKLTLSYPTYTRREEESISNIGDVNVPEGTVLKWTLQTSSADELFFDLAGNLSRVVPKLNEPTIIQTRALSSTNYNLWLSNANGIVSDTLRYSITVVPDALPMISTAELRDSIAPEYIHFRGHIKDDYGFSKLNFVAEVMSQGDTTITRTEKRSVEINFDEISQEFYFSFNIAELHLSAGDNVSYYFEVWDNDAVHGPKSARSQVYKLDIPTDKQVNELLNSNSDAIAERVNQMMTEFRNLQTEINDIMRTTVNNQTLSWQDKKRLEELQAKQRELQQQLKQLQQQIKENNRIEERYREQTEQILEKQRELDRLFEELMNDEMKEMLKQMDQLMQQMDQRKMQQQLEEMKLKSEDIEQELDRNLELMKRLELEKRMDESIRKASELASKQQQLADSTKQSGSNREALQRQQEQLSQDFHSLQEELKQIEAGYNELDKSNDMQLNQKLQQSIDQHQRNATNQMQRGNNSKAAEEQQSAADELNQLADDLADAQASMQEQSVAEDAQKVRELLKGLVSLSFSQEALIGDINRVMIQDPQYQTIITKQNKIKNDFKQINDSLQSISKRQFAVASSIGKELGDIRSSINSSMQSLSRFNQTFYNNVRNTGAARSMQYTMTSFNNLALLLAESLDKMQNQMRQSQQAKSNSQKRQGKPKSQSSCPNPGAGKPSPKSMRELQQQLSEQLKSMQQQLNKQGQQRSRTTIGTNNAMSEELARMAAQQEQIRRMLQQYGNELKQQRGGDPKLDREIDQMLKQMEQNETDIVNRTITQQTLMRQQQIVTRMLEHEKADLQQEQEERRESSEGREIPRPSPADWQKIDSQRNSNVDMFRSAPPSFSPFYKEKTNAYFF